jgi:hypothetical protein
MINVDFLVLFEIFVIFALTLRMIACATAKLTKIFL